MLEGEIWSPTTKQWTRVAAMSEARMHHLTALLLPDGRVVTAGGESTGRLHAQVYSPGPYLFKGPRPEITKSPGSVPYSGTFTVDTNASDNIDKVAIIRPSGVTHAIDMNERYVPLSFSASGTQLTVSGPANANDAPPGYYMLVVVNSNGVPSVAKWVHLGGNTGPPPETSGLPEAGLHRHAALRLGAADRDLRRCVGACADDVGVGLRQQRDRRLLAQSATRRSPTPRAGPMTSS